MTGWQTRAFIQNPFKWYIPCEIWIMLMGYIKQVPFVKVMLSDFTFWWVNMLILLLSGSSLNFSFSNSWLQASLLLRSSKWVKQHITKMSAHLTDTLWADGKELLDQEKPQLCLGHWVHLWETKQVELQANMGKIGPKLKSGQSRAPYLVYCALWNTLESLVGICVKLIMSAGNSYLIFVC